MIDESTNSLRDLSSQDRVQIEQQLHRMLKHPLFRSSKNLPPFLAYIVREALDPKSDGLLKERTVGIEVFARAADYDNNSDPVVRVTATALRKKLAQYYYESGHQDEIRIELRPGTYIPNFRPADSAESSADSIQKVTVQPAMDALRIVPLEPIAQTVDERDGTGQEPSRSRWMSWRWPSALVLVALAFVSTFLLHKVLAADKSSLDSFWKSVAGRAEHVLVVMPVIGSDDLVTAVASIRNESARPVLSLEDTNLAARVSTELQRHKTNYQIVSSSEVTLAELRNGPAVFIGALDNIWTMRLTKGLPFRFEESADNKTGRIVESAGGQRAWSVDIDKPHARIERDYGVVARFDNHLTGQPTIIIAGVSSQGTQAAGELLTSGEFEAVRAIASSSKNFEVVLQAEAIDGHSGQPKIIASRTW